MLLSLRVEKGRYGERAKELEAKKARGKSQREVESEK